MQAECTTQTTPFDFVDKAHFESTTDRAAARALFLRSVSMVEIEVFSYCNRSCWFCPNANIDRRSANTHMPASLYTSILNELAEIDYYGTISYSRYNEPLADEVIIERIREARATLPRAWLHTNTNGDYLTPDYLDRLSVSGLRGLNIQAYLGNNDLYDHEETRARIDKVTAKLGLPSTMVRDEPGVWLEVRLEYRSMLIRLYGRNFELNGCNRGTEVPIDSRQSRTSPCLLPFHHVYVDYNGSVMPCCNVRSDSPLHAECVIANLHDRPGIFLAYASEAATRWRRSLVGYGEKQGVCRTCRFVEFDPAAANRAKNAELVWLARGA